MTIIEILTPSYDAAWLPWAVQYFFLIGIATTTAITAAVAVLSPTQSTAKQLLPAAITVLLMSAIAAPVALLADLHQPGRFWHFYAYFTPWSWMSIGAVLLPIFITLCLLFSLSWWLEKIRLSRVLALALILSALSILVYTGAEIIVIRSRPLWNTYFLPINFALTGWLASLGAILLVARWLPGGVRALPTALLQRLSLLAVALLAVCALAWLLSGLMGFDASFAAAMELFSTYPIWRISLIGSIALALFLLVILRVSPERFSTPTHTLLCSATMLSAAWIFRWVVLMSVQGVPKYGAGLYLHSMPLGSSGLLGIIGVLGLCIALLSMVTWLLDKFPPYSSLRSTTCNNPTYLQGLIK